MALARVPRERRLRVGGLSSHVAPRSYTEEERHLAGAVPLHCTRTEHSQRGTARTRQARVFCHLPRDSHRNGACAGATRTPATRWRVQLARRTTVLHRRKEVFRRCSAPSWHVRRSQSARHGTRARQARMFLPPPERQPPQWRLRVGHTNAGCPLEVTACTSHHGLAPKERGLPPVQRPFMARTPISASAARHARAASSRDFPPLE